MDQGISTYILKRPILHNSLQFLFLNDPKLFSHNLASISLLVLVFWFGYCFVCFLGGSTQLCSGITTGAWRTKSGPGDRTWVNYMQDKFPICCTISLAPHCEFKPSQTQHTASQNLLFFYLFWQLLCTLYFFKPMYPREP